ncbi:hypothetical protein [uncultured Psychrobacter sp.]|uniref:hypothetical protein n=1 Tax=uncultured Psychrobacter sp. TaxID=259303 RepID=UPI003459650A
MLVSHLSKPFVSCLSLSICSLLVVNISGCFKSPLHAPGISGDIQLFVNNKGNLCFEPLFATTTESNSPVEIEHLKMRRLEIYNHDVPDDQSRTMLTIVPVNDEYYILEKGKSICLNTNNPSLKQNVFRPLQPQPVAVLIGGLDDEKEQTVDFHREFDYPYTPE